MSNASFLRPPKYRLQKSRGLAVVNINGRDIYVGKYGSAESKERYKRLIGVWLQTGGRLLPDRREVTTVAEVIAAFIGHARDYYRKHGKPLANSK